MADTAAKTLDELVLGMKIAMMTTRRADGHLVSRPMALQKKHPGSDFWFVTEKGSPKAEELAGDPHVNLGFYKDRTREFVSVAGTARLTDDRAIIRALWAPDWKAWFEDGSVDDPTLLLIGVTAETAQFLSLEKPQVVVLFQVLKGMLTGSKPDFGEVREVAGAELRGERTKR